MHYNTIIKYISHKVISIFKKINIDIIQICLNLSKP